MINMKKWRHEKPIGLKGNSNHQTIGAVISYDLAGKDGLGHVARLLG